MLTPKKVKKEVAAFQHLLGLKDWDLEVKFTVQEDDSIADCVADPEYKSAVISFNLDRLKGKRHLRETIIHELMHIIISQMTHYMKPLLTKEQKKLMGKLEHSIINSVEKWPVWKGM